MKRVICFLLVLLPLWVYSQQPDGAMLVISKDTLDKNAILSLEENWRFLEADSPAMADTGYDDSQWDIVNSELRLYGRSTNRYEKFNSIGWFRFRFLAEQDIVGVPISLALHHLGASEVFLDGKKISTFGKVGSKDSTIYFIPQTLPVTFVLQFAGHHVLAVRYANYDAQKNNTKYNENTAGFRAKLGYADNVSASVLNRAVSICFVFNLLCGIFLALCVAHLFLFFYDRSSKSNLYFSFFCFCIATSFFIPGITVIGKVPIIPLSSHFTVPFLVSGMCVSLSGFINGLFSERKRRFVVIAGACILAPFVFFAHIGYGFGIYGIVICSVALEAIILVVRAIYKKKKGARIIGAGVLLLAAFVLFTTIYVSIFDDINFGGDNPWEIVVFVILALAILSLPVSMSLYLAWSFASVNKDLKYNLAQVKELSEKTIEQELERVRMVETQNEQLEAEVKVRTAEVVSQKEEIEQQHNELKAEKQKSDDLLLNILPAEIAEELKEKGQTAARLYNDVSVLFTDFVAFTKAGERMGPQELVDELHSCFKTFDEIIARHNIEKIKTIGDAYLAVGGLPQADADHAVNAVNAAIDILEFMKARKEVLKDKTFQIRIGIHSGSVVAGIVGIRKFAYDIWGDTVNTAARMEQNSESDKINISASTYELVKDKFECEHRGKIDAKNKGELNMYFVVGRLPSSPKR